MQIRQLDPSVSPRDAHRFARFPLDLYHNCPQWVPPLFSDAQALLDPRKHPFYEHSDAAFYIAEERGRVLGLEADRWPLKSRLNSVSGRAYRAYRAYRREK